MPWVEVQGFPGGDERRFQQFVAGRIQELVKRDWFQVAVGDAPDGHTELMLTKREIQQRAGRHNRHLRHIFVEPPQESQ